MINSPDVHAVAQSACISLQVETRQFVYYECENTLVYESDTTDAAPARTAGGEYYASVRAEEQSAFTSSVNVLVNCVGVEVPGYVTSH